MKRRIVIWGDDHHNALGLLRMLGGHGFEILFLVHRVRHEIATASRYCEKYVIVSSIDEGLEYLYRHYSDKNNKAVLLFTADKFSEAANENLEKLKDFFFVAGPSKESSLEQIDDKFYMGELAKKCGINVPDTVLLPPFEESIVKSYPVVIKPCSPKNKEFKVKIVKNRTELSKLYSNLIPTKRYVLQQFIQKEADGLVYGCRTQDGKTYLSGICVRNRWSDDGCGSFGYITGDIPETINTRGISEFLELIDFRGLFSVEFALTENNSYFYEFNLRNDGTAVLFYQSGSNMALTYVNSCFGIKNEASTKSQGKKYLINEFWDEFNVKDGIITKQQWKEDFDKSTIFFYYDPDDMVPYEVQKSLTLKRKLRRIIAKSYINKIRLNLKKQIMNRRKN